MPSAPVRVLIQHGHSPTPWTLTPWTRLPGRFRPEVVVTGSVPRSLDALGLPQRRARTVRDMLPGGPLGDVAALALRDRVLDPEALYAGAGIVHAAELGSPFAAQAARLKASLGYRLVLTVWETLPMLAAYRNGPNRGYREEVLAGTDLFLPCTQRARDALLLEGAPEDRIRVVEPGIDVARFAATAPAPPDAASEHLVLSPGRLEWEKGHHDVLRAIAALRRGLVGEPRRARVLFVGDGPERGRLERHAAELGLGDAVEFRSVPYEEMPALYARASCMVLASVSRASGALHPADVPRLFWEEQFGMVLVEAMAAGLPLVLSRSGAIPEVAGETADYFRPGDFMALARTLASGPLSRAPGARVEHPAERLERFSVDTAARGLAAAYDAVL